MKSKTDLAFKLFWILVMLFVVALCISDVQSEGQVRVLLMGESQFPLEFGSVDSICPYPERYEPDSVAQDFEDITYIVSWDMYVPQSNADRIMTHFEVYFLDWDGSIMMLGTVPKSGTSLSWIGPADGVIKSFFVLAVNKYGKSGMSNTASIIPPLIPIESGPPAPPQTIAVKAMWNAVDEFGDKSLNVRLSTKDSDTFELTLSLNSSGVTVTEIVISLEGGKKFDHVSGAKIVEDLGVNNDGKSSQTITILTPMGGNQTLTIRGDIDGGETGMTDFTLFAKVISGEPAQTFQRHIYIDYVDITPTVTTGFVRFF